MKIGILQTGHAPDELLPQTGDYDAFFERLLDGHGFTFETFNVVDNDFPVSVQDADGWLITGSRHGTYEDHPWIAPLEQFIRDIVAAGRPLVGICFGHQIIAQAMGGKVEKFGGGWAVGRQTYVVNGERLALNAWHQDQVTELPATATVVGANPFCDYAALTYGKNIFTIQPHPEYDASFIDALIRTRGRGVVPENLLAQAQQSLAGPTDNARVAQHLAAVLKQGSGS